MFLGTSWTYSRESEFDHNVAGNRSVEFVLCKVVTLYAPLVSTNRRDVAVHSAGQADPERAGRELRSARVPELPASIRSDFILWKSRSCATLENSRVFPFPTATTAAIIQPIPHFRTGPKLGGRSRGAVVIVAPRHDVTMYLPNQLLVDWPVILQFCNPFVGFQS